MLGIRIKATIKEVERILDCECALFFVTLLFLTIYCIVRKVSDSRPKKESPKDSWISFLQDYRSKLQI